MKRLLLLLLAVSCFAIGQCAPSHLKFNGIPINGTISSFTRAMNQKGWKVSPASQNMPVGQRYFENQVQGHHIVVSYDPHTKIVYAVTSVQETDAATALKWFTVQKEVLRMEYVDNSEGCTAATTSSAEGELPLFGVGVNDGDCNQLGTITIRLEYDPQVTGTTFMFTEYRDHANTSRFLGR